MICPNLQVPFCPDSHQRTPKGLFSGFGGLEVACWPLVPKFAGSNPAEVVVFFRAKKILSTPFVAYLRHVEEPESVCVEVAASGPNYRPFLAQVVPPFTHY